MTAREAALEAIVRVACEGQSLDTTLAPVVIRLDAPRDRALARELVYGVLRWHPRLEALLALLLERPLRRRDCDLGAVLRLGLYQLAYTRTPARAAVSESVELARHLGKAWGTGLINGVLRRFEREREALLARLEGDEVAALAHPAWLLEALREAWPEGWRAVAEASNARAPMCLRVNRRRGSREAYLARLAERGLEAHATPWSSDGVALATPMESARLAGFAEGEVSVQDQAAQLAQGLLAVGPGHRVLDACAAPGGKCAHLLETLPWDARLVALDRDPRRLEVLRENLERLGLEAEVRQGDAADPHEWWDGAHFDRILLDAPCSATGVMRRHPDIKLHRRPGDVERLAGVQSDLLRALWPLLTPSGMLLYATCSILPRENDLAVRSFLAEHPDARAVGPEAAWGRPTDPGRQILPGEDGMDGFYYAALAKR